MPKHSRITYYMYYALTGISYGRIYHRKLDQDFTTDGNQHNSFMVTRSDPQEFLLEVRRNKLKLNKIKSLFTNPEFFRPVSKVPSAKNRLS